MVERLELVGYDELSVLGADIRGVRLIRLIGREEYDVMMSLLYTHLQQTVETSKTFGVIVPTLGLFMEQYGEKRTPSMMVMHVSQMDEQELVKHLPRMEESAIKYSGKYIFVSAEATITVKQTDDIGGLDSYEMDGIKTTIYHKSGAIDLISEIEISDKDPNSASLSRPMIIEGLGEFDHLFDHILTGASMVVQ
jgi:hypothetical protein